MLLFSVELLIDQLLRFIVIYRANGTSREGQEMIHYNYYAEVRKGGFKIGNT